MLSYKTRTTKEAGSTTIQPKLKIGKPGDKYEQEADAVAERVMRMSDSNQMQMQPIEEEEEMLQPKLRMQPEEEEELIQPKLRMQPEEEEEEMIQPKLHSGSNFASSQIAREINSTKGNGSSLSPEANRFMSNAFGNDFGSVKIHTGSKAVQMNNQLGARAFTLGNNIYFNKGEFNPNSSVGKNLLAHELTHVVQQGGQADDIISRDPIPETMAAESVTEVQEEPAAEKTDEELAADIMRTQYAILVGWDTALSVFDKVLTSSSDKETKPEFKNVIKSFLEEKLMSEIISRSNLPGAGDAFTLFGKLSEEAKRASEASKSATLRDFYVQHKTGIGTLKQLIMALEVDFIAKVRKTRKRMEEAEAISGIASSPESEEYGLMRMHLVETIEALNDRLKISKPEDLFQALSEQWIQMATVIGGMGIKFQAVVIIRLKKDYSVINGEIQGTGGQKIAEQLLKFSPNGVDVFGLKAPRRVIVYADNGWPSAILRLDENNRNVNEGSFAEGNWRAIERYVMANGLPPTKNITGD